MGLFLTIVMALATIIGGSLYVSDTYGNYQCNNYAEITGSKTKWATLDVCYVEKDGQYYRWDEYKQLFLGKESIEGIL